MEKRRFFRIDDRMELRCEPLTEDQAADAENLMTPVDTQSMLASYDRQIQTIIDSARVQAPAVASLAEMLNRKMNFIISALDIGDKMLETVAFATQRVNLSACGLAFDTDQAHERGEQLRVEMRLQPHDLHLVVLARVVGCSPVVDPSPGRQFHVQLDFASISPADQELLIQHIVRRQSLLLQEERHAREREALGD